MKNRIIKTILLLAIIIASGSCKKWVEVDGPETSVGFEQAFNSDATAIGVITSLYADLGNQVLGQPGYLTSLSCVAGLSADELSYFSGATNPMLNAYYTNSLSTQNVGDPGYWGAVYTEMYVVNTAIEELSRTTLLSPKVKQQLMGEAKFLRAFYYFYLTNLYGDVPLILGTDYTINARISKVTQSEIYKQILLDLTDAQSLLSDHYVQGDAMTAYPSDAEERVRPNKWTAIALLARVHLYQANWPETEAEASKVLANQNEYHLETLDRTFSKNNKEAIWQVLPTKGYQNTSDADLFVLKSTGPSAGNPVYLNEKLVKGFEDNDGRFSAWVGSVFANGKTYYYANKYKIIASGEPSPQLSEYSTVMRLGEQFLIRAEARAQLGNLSGAISDLDEIRKRAGLPLIVNTNPNIGKEELLSAILKERRMELFTEWGHRWFDLKRTNRADAVLGQLKGTANWQSSDQLYPIPQSELETDVNLDQNPGYE